MTVILLANASDNLPPAMETQRLALPGFDCGTCGTTFHAALRECPVCAADERRKISQEKAP
jgi:rubrerythrin